MAFKSEKMFFTEKITIDIKINSVLVSDLKEPFEKVHRKQVNPENCFSKKSRPQKRNSLLSLFFWSSLTKLFHT
jgi:hypothetical protein